MEIGERDQVLQAPRHPYTRKLIAAVPALYPELHVPCADGEMALRIEHLNKTYHVEGRQVCALKDVSLQLPRGKTLAIVGESGSGKSTLVKAAIRLVDSDSGHVWLGDSDFLALKGEALTRGRRQIQMIFQDPQPPAESAPSGRRHHRPCRATARAVGRGRMDRSRRLAGAGRPQARPSPGSSPAAKISASASPAPWPCVLRPPVRRRERFGTGRLGAETGGAGVARRLLATTGS